MMSVFLAGSPLGRSNQGPINSRISGRGPGGLEVLGSKSCSLGESMVSEDPNIVSPFTHESWAGYRIADEKPPFRQPVAGSTAKLRGVSPRCQICHISW